MEYMVYNKLRVPETYFFNLLKTIKLKAIKNAFNFIVETNFDELNSKGFPTMKHGLWNWQRPSRIITDIVPTKLQIFKTQLYRYSEFPKYMQDIFLMFINNFSHFNLVPYRRTSQNRHNRWRNKAQSSQ